MRIIRRLLIALLTVVSIDGSAHACTGMPSRIPIFWNAPPEKLQPGEVVLELEVLAPVYRTDSPQEQAEWEKRRAERIAAGEEVENPLTVSCQPTAVFAYRVKRVLRGSFPHNQIVVSPGFDIWDENLQPRLNRIVVGKLADTDWLGRPANTQWFTTNLFDHRENKFESIVFIPRPPDPNFEPAPLARSSRWAQIVVFGGSQRIGAALFGPPSLEGDPQDKNRPSRLIPFLIVLALPIGIAGCIYVTRRRGKRSPP